MLKRIRNILCIAILIYLVSNYLIVFEEREETIPPPPVPPNKEFVVVTFHTGDQKYVQSTERLIVSCKKFDIECIPTVLPAQKLKTRTLAQKPRFILSQLDRFQMPVLWVDCDLVFYKFPSLLTSEKSEGQDVMLINWDPAQGNKLATLSGVMYFNNTPKSRQLLSWWNNALLYSTNKDAPDDQVMETFFTSYELKQKMNVTYLPKEYLYIEDWFGKSPNEVIGHPDHSTGWSLIRPQNPPWEWLAGHYVKSSPLDYLIVWTCAEPQSGLLSQLGKVSIGQSCTEFNISVTFWEPVILVGIDTNLKAQINLLVPDPHFLGCTRQKYEQLAKSSMSSPTTPIICAERCRGKPFFCMTEYQGGECWCGKMRLNITLEDCKLCDDPDLKRLCPKDLSVSLLYVNEQKRVNVEDLSHIGMGIGVLDHYFFEVKKESEESISWFKPTVKLEK